MPDPVAGAKTDVLDLIVKADERAAQKREAKEKRVFAVAAAAVAVLAGAVILFGIIAFTAMTNQREAREAASRRIDILNEQIDDLGADLSAEARTNGERIGELSAQIAALQEQVRQLGGEPVVITTSGSSGSPTTTAPPTTTTTRPPSTTTTTSPPSGGVCVLGICLGG